MPSLLPGSASHVHSPRTVLRRSTSDLYLASVANDPVLQNGFHVSGEAQYDPFTHSGPKKHSRRLTDTGYQSRGLYGSQDYHQPPTTYTPIRYDPNDSHTHDRVLNDPDRLGHFSDTDSVDDNFESFQGMLAIVNHQMVNQQQRPQGDPHSVNFNISGITNDHSHSMENTTLEDSELKLNLSELQEGGGESPRKSRPGTRMFSGKLGSRPGASPSSRDGVGRSPRQSSSSLGHRPKIMQSPCKLLFQLNSVLIDIREKYKLA